MILGCLLRLLPLLLRLYLSLSLLLLKLLSGPPSILLVEDVLIAAHALSLDNAELFAFLVPAPLVDLSLGQLSFDGDFSQHLLCPMRISFKSGGELLKLEGRLALSLANNPLKLATLLVKDMTSLFGDLQASGRLNRSVQGRVH